MAKTNPQRVKYVNALKSLDEGPRKIEAALETYKSDLSAIRDLEKSGNYSPNYVNRMKAQAQQKRDAVVGETVSQLRENLSTVREHSAAADMLDVDDPTLQNSLRIIEAAGKKLNPSAQLSILQKFRGNTPALEFLADLYDKNGYYYASEARKMITPVNTTAMDNLEYCLESWDMFGKWPADKMFWTKNDFRKAVERVDGGEKDPYISALEDLARDKNASVRAAASKQLEVLKNGGVDPEEQAILKKVLDDLVAMAKNPDNADAMEADG